MNGLMFSLAKKYLASSFLLVVFITLYIFDESHGWVADLLPINGKPLVVFIAVGLCLVYESLRFEMKNKLDVGACKDKIMMSKIDDLTRLFEVGQLTNSVNSMYSRFMASGDEFINDEYAVKEIGQLTDERERLKVNSFVEGRLNYLRKRIKAR